MRYVKYSILAVLAIALIVVFIANSGAVTLHLVPESFARYVPFQTSLSLPLFIILILSIGVGLMIGFVWEWIREMRLRGAAQKDHKKLVRLQREVDRLKTSQAKADGDQDEILALLDDSK